MELNFASAAKVEERVVTIPKFLEPGNHMVRIVEITKGESAKKNTPFVEITVQDKQEAKCSHIYYISEGSMPYTTRAILTLIQAALDCTEDVALTKVEGISTENIDSKLATVLVGKEIAISIAGEEVLPTEEGKTKWVKSVFGGFTFARPVKDASKLSTKIHIKKAEETVKVETKADDLPW